MELQCDSIVSPLAKAPDDVRPLDEDMAAARATAIASGLDFGDDFKILFNATEEELTELYADGVTRGLTLLSIDDESTVNEARAKFGLPPVEGGDEVPAIVGQVNERAVEYARTRSADLVTQISENTRTMLRATITQAIEEGWGAAALADELEDSAGFSEARSEAIARTEVIRANNQGNLAAYKESGVATGKIWSTSNDDLVDDICDENEAEGPIGLDEDFPSGDDAPPSHTNCRCAVLPWTDPLDESDEDEGG